MCVFCVACIQSCVSYSSSSLSPCCDCHAIARKHVSHTSQSMTVILFGGPAMGTVSSVCAFALVAAMIAVQLASLA